YAVFAPVYVVGWDDETRRFLVDLSEQRPGEVASPARSIRQLELPEIRTPDSPSEIRELTRRYVVTNVQRRLREARFRNAVLEAYDDHCAVCELHVRALLDAAHVADGGPQRRLHRARARGHPAETRAAVRRPRGAPHRRPRGLRRAWRGR